MAAEPRASRANRAARHRAVTTGSETRSRVAPLAVTQEALWYRSILAPTLLTYNETISIRKDGPLDVTALRSAFDEIVRRHEAWRSTFDLDDGEPVQVIRPAPAFAFPATDLSHLPADEAERQALKRIAEISRIPYDLARGPLIRPCLFHFPGEHHRLYLAMNHLVFDGVTLTRTVLPELVTLYEASLAGTSPPLAAPKTSYSDYARWEQQWILEPAVRRRLDYWVERLGDSPALELPTDRPRRSEPLLGGGSVPLLLPRGDLDRLRGVGQASGATVFQMLAASWSLLLARFSGERTVVFATAADMRQRPELLGLVGCCLTPLVLRVDVTDDLSVKDLVVRVRNELLDGLDHLVPFERVVRELPSTGNRGINPVYQTMLVLEPATDVADPSWSVDQIDSPLANAVGSFKLDLELQLDERPDGHLAGQLIFDRDLFDEATAVALADQWLGICLAVADDADAPVGAILSAVGAGERRRQLFEWNATSVDWARATVPELIAARALAQPDSIALSDAEREVTYAEVDETADRIAASLASAGVGSGELVAVSTESSINLALGSLGALRAGGALLLLDPALDSDQLRRRVEVAEVTAVLAEDGDRLGSSGTPTLLFDALNGGTPPIAPVAARAAESACLVQPLDSSPATVESRVFSHGTAVNLAASLAVELDFSAEDTVLALASNLFSTPLVDLFLPLIAGARIVVAPAGAETDGARISQMVAAESVSFMHAAPATWAALLGSGLAASRSLRALSGGGPLAGELAEQLLDRFRVLWNAYGVPETGYCTLGRVESSGPVTVGRPLANVRAYVLSGHAQPVEIGTPGALVIAADRPLSWAHSGKDLPGAELADPFARGVAYETGDRARWLADGRLEIQ